MRVLFNTNVIIDLFGKTEDLKNAYAAYDTALLRAETPCVCAGSLSDVFYLLTARKYTTKPEARKVIKQIYEVFEVIDTLAADGLAATTSKMSDFEDAVIAAAAKREGIDVIITRNKRDFKYSPVPALTPKEYLKLYQLEGVDYDEVSV